MVAIPVFRSRVAPVLNWCSKVFIFSEDGEDGDSSREEVLLKTDAFELLRLLQAKGVHNLICGALSPELLRYGTHLGFNMICGMAGEVEEILRAYRAKKLDQRCFRLPGYRCQCPYRETAGSEPVKTDRLMEEGSAMMPGGKGQGGRGKGGSGGGRGRMGGTGGGPGGFCVCPQCGIKEPHKQGIPCPQVQCPQCGRAMVRG